MNELKFDIEKLQAAQKKCVQISQDLCDKKNELLEQLIELRQDWNTPAGKKFFEDQNDDWVEQVDSYVKITGAISELLSIAIREYNVIADQANHLQL